MAKQPVKVKQQVPATTTSKAERVARMKETAGQGISTKATDNLVPLIGVLQPLSPQALTKNQAYIKGAEAGDFYARALGTPVLSGGEGIWFQPCGMYSEWVEWVPRDQGGGFVGRHDYNDGSPPKGAKAKPRPEGSRKPQAYTMGKNDLVDTRYVPGNLWLEGQAYAFVIPFTSTGHAVARGWMTKQSGEQENGSILASYNCLYKLTTRSTKNNLGEWYKIDVGAPVRLFTPEGDINEEAEEIVGNCDKAFELGKQLYTSFERKEKTAAAEEARGEQDEDQL